MFTIFAIVFTVLASIMIPHGGKRYTTISNIGCFFGIIAIILWAVVVVALFIRTFHWLWAYAP